MKSSIVVASSHAAPEAFAVLRGFDEASAIAHDLGYDGVELALKCAEEVSLGSISRSLQQRGLEVSAISTGQVFSSCNLMFTDGDAERRSALLKLFSSFIDLAAELGCPVNIGRVRGCLGDGDSSARRMNAVDGIRKALDYAELKGVTLLLEPVNRAEIDFINSIPDAMEFIAALDRPNIALMPDSYHMSIEDPDNASALTMAGGLVRYMHIADSNRQAPGKGNIDFRGLFRTLRSIGYDGWCTVECLPVPDPITAARESVDSLRELFRC